jgi:RHS repeat-associated protein
VKGGATVNTNESSNLSARPLGMAATFLALASCLAPPLLAAAPASVVEYYHLDGLGTVRAVSDADGNLIATENRDYLPYGEEWCATGPCSGVPAGQPKRFTGKERDPETGLDYFGARYYGAGIGRFTTVDPVYTWQENLVDPQRWNRYAYARDNPLRYVDPDGEAIETPWDAINVGIGVASFVANVRAGNVGGAVLDAVGVVYDATATAVPGLPGGAGTLIKAARTADRVADIVKAGDRAADVSKVVRGGETAATKAGREAHRKFAEKVRAKADQGWQSEPTIKGPNDEVLRPDAITPSGRPVELKPNTPSGRRRGESQLKKYEEATGKKGRVVYYDP